MAPAVAPQYSCHPAYGYGPYGCYKLRAKGSRNFQPNGGHDTPTARALEDFRQDLCFLKFKNADKCFTLTIGFTSPSCLQRQRNDLGYAKREVFFCKFWDPFREWLILFGLPTAQPSKTDLWGANFIAFFLPKNLQDLLEFPDFPISYFFLIEV